MWRKFYFGKEINANVFTSAFLITLAARLPVIYHPTAHMRTPRLKKEFPHKIHSQVTPGCTRAMQGSVHVTTFYANSWNKEREQKRDTDRKRVGELRSRSESEMESEGSI